MSTSKRLLSLRHIGTNSFWTFLSRVTGVVKQMVFTYLFGSAGDTFWAAFRLVNAFRRYIGEGGALGSAFIPVFMQVKERDGEEAAKIFAFRVMTVFGLFSLGGALVLSVTAFWYGPWLAPGFSPERMREYILLMILMMPYIPLVNWYAFRMGILNSFSLFGSSAAAPVLFNLVFIGLPLFFAGTVGIFVSALSVVIGALGMVALQWGDMHRIGFAFRPVWEKHPAEERFWGLFWPTAGNMVALTVKNFLATWFLSFFVGGYVVYMNAFTVISAPLGFIAIAVGTVMMPLLSRFQEKGNREEFLLAVEEGFLFLFYWTIPLMVYMVIFPETVNRVLFYDLFLALVGKTGRMTPQLLEMSHEVLSLFALSLLPMSAAVVFEKIFYATHDARTPLRSSILTLVLTGGLYFLAFLPMFGVKGVIIAETVSSYVVMGYYMASLKREVFSPMVWWRIGWRAGVWLGVSVLLGLLGKRIYQWGMLFVPEGWGYLFFAAGIFGIFMGLYVVCTKIFRVEFHR
ncbi:MAG: polysaccharide biosynthesis C-terminal domain-containing protein [Brevinematales bacterium]|nr:polysaccharide biosynthesis C-terminal domain-containing protein [Brevinematales bacterium]